MLGAIPLDVMLPSYPAMGAHFGKPVAYIAWSVSVFALGFAAAQLVVGPMSDHFGRKWVLIAALGIAAMGSVMTIFTDDFNAFLVLRVIQGVGCSSFVLAQAIVQDEYSGRAATRARVYVTSANGVLIAVSPVCGAILQATLGWRGSFGLFAALSLALMAICVCRYNAPRPAPQQARAVPFYIKEYARILSDMPFVAYWLVGSIAFSCHFAFIVASPLIFLGEMGMGPEQFSLILLIYGLAYVVAGVVTSRLISCITEVQAIYGGVSVIALAGCAMYFLQSGWEGSPISVLIPMLLCTFGTALVRPCAATLAMSRFTTSAGTAAAAGSSIRMLVGGVLGGFTAAMGRSASSNLVVLLLLSAIVCLVVLRALPADSASVEA
jgi:predicted MFS family arabinose efflux permease